MEHAMENYAITTCLPQPGEFNIKIATTVPSAESKEPPAPRAKAKAKASPHTPADK